MRFSLSQVLQIGVLACSQSPRALPFSGRFVLDRGAAQDTLTLLPDGRYRHSAAFPGREILVDSGTWQLTTVDGRQLLQINHWVQWSAPDSQQRIPAADAGTWFARVDTLPDGTLSIPLDGGEGGAFVSIR